MRLALLPLLVVSCAHVPYVTVVNERVDDTDPKPILLASADVGSSVRDWYTSKLLRQPTDWLNLTVTSVTVNGAVTIGGAGKWTITNGTGVAADSLLFNFPGTVNPLEIISTGAAAGYVSTTLGFRVGGTGTNQFICNAGSGNNCLAVNTNGARIDFGAGASDYASSDGTTVTFAGSLAQANSTAFSTGASGTFNIGLNTGFRMGAASNQPVMSNTAPTISAAGTSPTIVSSNGTASVRVNVGTGGTATGFTLTLPTAGNRWICNCQNASTPTTVAKIVQTGYSTTTCVMEQRTVATNVALAFAGSDLVDCNNMGQ